MDPQMMEQAQNMMRNMTPEQMANMRQMMSQMSPDQMANMQRMASTMGLGASPGLTPQSSHAAYHLSGAHVLKGDGNALHKAGNHADALVKYNQALDNLDTQTSAEAMALKTSCELNKAMCHLKLKQWHECIKICTQALQRGPNIKALYRRGQAYLGLNSFRAAIQDLQHASALCPVQDTAQQDLIAAKLSYAKEGLTEQLDNFEPEPVSYNDGSATVEEVLPERHVPARSFEASAPPNASATLPSANGCGDAARSRLEAMCNMPEEHLRQAATAAGMPKMDGKTAKQMAEMMRGMDPQQLNDLMAMSEQVYSSQHNHVRASGANAAAMDPAVAAEMMRNMTPEQIQTMAQAAADSGMLPPGVDINPDMLKQSAELMKNMTPEGLQHMHNMASSAQQNSVMPSQLGLGSKPDSGMGVMADMLKDPTAMKQAMHMMKHMDEGQLANLMKMNQPSMSDEDARLMAQQMKRADERFMGILLGGVSVLAQARANIISVCGWFTNNPAALIAVLLLLLAVVMRYLGIM